MNMFDELHDPNPPTPSSEHLAAVATRARRIRTRRWATTAMAFVAVLGLGFGAVIANDDGDNIKVETPPTTVPPPTSTEPSTTPPDTAPRTPPTTDAPETTPEATPTSNPTSNPTTPPPTSEPIPLGALNAGGDAVVVGADGTPDVVWEAMDPPEEGEGSYPESVLPAGDAGPLLVGFCCEPASGTVYRIAPDTPDGRMPVVEGVAPARSENGRLATAHLTTAPPIITVLDEGSDDTTSIDLDDGVFAGSADLMWVSEEQLVVLVEDLSTNTTQLLSIHVPSQTITGPVEVDGQASFAGIDADGSIIVLENGVSTLSTYDPDTLEEVENDLDLPASAQSAWFADGHAAWVADDGTLTIDGTVVDGRYQWGRG